MIKLRAGQSCLLETVKDTAQLIALHDQFAKGGCPIQLPGFTKEDMQNPAFSLEEMKKSYSCFGWCSEHNQLNYFVYPPRNRWDILLPDQLLEVINVGELYELYTDTSGEYDTLVEVLAIRGNDVIVWLVNELIAATVHVSNELRLADTDLDDLEEQIVNSRVRVKNTLALAIILRSKGYTDGAYNV